MTASSVILIGGPPGAGKSTLGAALASSLGYVSLTGDDLLVAARALTTEKSHPAFHAIGGEGWLHYFTEGPKAKLVSDALAQEQAMWSVLERVIRARLIKETPVVVDWWLLRPRKVSHLSDDRIRSFWLQIDPGALWDRERRNTGWDDSSDPERMLDNFMHRSLWWNQLVAAEAEKYGLPVLYLTGGESVDALVERVLEEL